MSGPLRTRFWRSSRSGMVEWVIEDSTDTFELGRDETMAKAEANAKAALEDWTKINTEQETRA